MPNVFEELLTNIAEADRDVFSGLAERNPSLKDYVADPAKVRRVDEVETWYANNYDFEHNCTKEEYARALRIEALQAQLAAAPKPGEEMTLEQLNAFLDEKITTGKVVSAQQVKDELKTAVEAKEREFGEILNNQLNAVASTATISQYLSNVHRRDFPDDALDPRDLFTKANLELAAKRAVDPNAQIDLEKYYFDTYTGEKRTAMATAKAAADKAAHDAELAAARLEGRKEALQAQVGESRQGSPSMDEGPDVGHFQLKLMQKAAPKSGEDGKPQVIEAELGRGQIANIRAREHDRAAISGNAA